LPRVFFPWHHIPTIQQLNQEISNSYELQAVFVLNVRHFIHIRGAWFFPEPDLESASG